jgi:hypothetical protein
MDIISIITDYTSTLGGSYSKTLDGIGLIKPNTILVITSEDRQIIANVIAKSNENDATLVYIGSTQTIIDQISEGIGRAIFATSATKDIITAAENYNYGQLTISAPSTSKYTKSTTETATSTETPVA